METSNVNEKYTKLSSEMDLAEIRFTRKAFIKERGVDVLEKFFENL
jgi:hypothetical protein